MGFILVFLFYRSVARMKLQCLAHSDCVTVIIIVFISFGAISWPSPSPLPLYSLYQCICQYRTLISIKWLPPHTQTRIDYCPDIIWVLLVTSKTQLEVVMRRVHLVQPCHCSVEKNQSPKKLDDLPMFAQLICDKPEILIGSLSLMNTASIRQNITPWLSSLWNTDFS